MNQSLFAMSFRKSQRASGLTALLLATGTWLAAGCGEPPAESAPAPAAAPVAPAGAQLPSASLTKVQSLPVAAPPEHASVTQAFREDAAVLALARALSDEGCALDVTKSSIFSTANNTLVVSALGACTGGDEASLNAVFPRDASAEPQVFAVKLSLVDTAQPAAILLRSDTRGISRSSLNLAGLTPRGGMGDGTTELGCSFNWGCDLRSVAISCSVSSGTDVLVSCIPAAVLGPEAYVSCVVGRLGVGAAGAAWCVVRSCVHVSCSW